MKRATIVAVLALAGLALAGLALAGCSYSGGGEKTVSTHRGFAVLGADGDVTTFVAAQRAHFHAATVRDQPKPAGRRYVALVMPSGLSDRTIADLRQQALDAGLIAAEEKEQTVTNAPAWQIRFGW